MNKYNKHSDWERNEKWYRFVSVLSVDCGAQSWCWSRPHRGWSSEGGSQWTERIKEQGLRDFCCKDLVLTEPSSGWSWWWQFKDFNFVSASVPALFEEEASLCDILFKLINSKVRSLMSQSNTILNFAEFTSSPDQRYPTKYEQFSIFFTAKTLIRVKVKMVQEREEEDTAWRRLSIFCT